MTSPSTPSSSQPAAWACAAEGRWYVSCAAVGTKRCTRRSTMRSPSTSSRATSAITSRSRRMCSTRRFRSSRLRSGSCWQTEASSIRTVSRAMSHMAATSLSRRSSRRWLPRTSSRKSPRLGSAAGVAPAIRPETSGRCSLARTETRSMLSQTATRGTPAPTWIER